MPGRALPATIGVPLRYYPVDLGPIRSGVSTNFRARSEATGTMRVILRLFTVVFALLAACIAGGLVVAVAVALPERRNLALALGGPNALDEVLGVWTMFAGLFVLLPAALVALGAELFRVRSVLFYLVIGAGIGLAVFTLLSTWNWSPATLDAETEWHIVALLGAGLFAGLVYWAIAGCNAGAWRRPRA